MTPGPQRAPASGRARIRAAVSSPRVILSARRRVGAYDNPLRVSRRGEGKADAALAARGRIHLFRVLIRQGTARRGPPSSTLLRQSAVADDTASVVG